MRNRQVSHFWRFRQFFPVPLRAMPEGYGIGVCSQSVFIDGGNHVAVGGRQRQDLPRSRDTASEKLLRRMRVGASVCAIERRVAGCARGKPRWCDCHATDRAYLFRRSGTVGIAFGRCSQNGWASRLVGIVRAIGSEWILSKNARATSAPFHRSTLTNGVAGKPSRQVHPVATGTVSIPPNRWLCCNRPRDRWKRLRLRAAC